MIAGGLAFAAGILSILSPCVLPLLPLILGAASAEHRLGPVALAAGLSISFVGIGLFVALIGFSIGLDGDVFRTAAAMLMIAVGVVLILPAMQARLAMAGGPFVDWTERRFAGLPTSGLPGQFGVGLLLGAVWSPCVGPTLGAASLLAAQGRELPQVFFTMLMFGLGAALPLVVFGMLFQRLLATRRGGLLAAGKVLKPVLGGFFVLVGIAIVTGFDRGLEAGLVDASPQWLTDLTTRI